MAALEEKEWTLMFYFASNTSLAPDIVTQLKALKQAGFHPDVNVVAQFDPQAENVETHVFDVNRINKIQAEGAHKIGFVGFNSNDPFVVNLMTDKLWRNDEKEGPIRTKIIDSLKRPRAKGASMVKGFDFDPPEPPPVRKQRQADEAGHRRTEETWTDSENETSDELSPEESLDGFLTFCSQNYPARHYILFILGHGLVVGNDTFLFDENAPVHFLRLRNLGLVLDRFKTNIATRDGKKTGAAFELVSFHSCSMSSLEVAAELQGIANYMLASQSPSFVGSWPYRQILIRMFNYLTRKETDVLGLLQNFFYYCLFNSNDFLVAGYSFDLCLCNLSRVSEVEGPVYELAASLVAGLSAKDQQAQALIKERVLLAHLDAQSYFNENYTDLFDFCLSLQQRIKAAQTATLPAELTAISEACLAVMKVLRRGVENDDTNRLIVRSDFLGPTYQYSHGLSVYFPWAQPIADRFWPTEYNAYKFIKPLQDAGKTSWSDFLKTYFAATMRRTREDEFRETQAPGFEHEIRPPGPLPLDDDLLEAFATGFFDEEGQLGTKPGPDSSQGAGCDCQSIKNYPRFTRVPQSGADNGTKAVVSPTFLHDAKRPPIVFDGLTEE